MKKFSVSFIVLLITLCFIPVIANAVGVDSLVTMYAPDGRSISINAWEVDAYKKVGWYDDINEVKTTLYSLDGRSIKVWNSEVEAYKNVGWYENINDVKATLYALDGRSIQVWKSEIDKYASVGWYLPVQMYALDGRVIEIPIYQVELYRNVGWFTYEDYMFLWLSYEYDECVSSGDYISAINMICEYQDVFWNTGYAHDVIKMKHKAMDVVRDAAQQPLIVDWYEVSEGVMEVSLMNVSYKDVIAFKFNCTTYDVFGDPIKYFGEIDYYSDNVYIPSGEWEILSWDVNSQTKWADEFSVFTVVYSDGTIWNG